MLTLALTGDICPTRRLASRAAHYGSIFDHLNTASLTIGNLEMPLSRKGTPLEKLLNIRADPAIAEDLPLLGLDVVTLANNHAVDYGWEALDDTAGRVQARGIATIGMGPDWNAASAPFFADVGGLRVGVIAFSCLTPASSGATDERPGIAALRIKTAYEIDPLYQAEEPGDLAVVKVRTHPFESDLARALAVVRDARMSCDRLVVTIHWGFGSGEELAEYQRPLAEAFIDAGADLVHGHHPHAIHAIGFHAGKPIIFSSGTLVGQQIFLPASDQVQALWAGMSPDGFISIIELEDGNTPRIRLIPHTLDAERLPVPAEGEVFERIARRLKRLSPAQGAEVTSFDGGLYVRPL